MRLKQLEVAGFKSFAHRTVLDFPAGITAIVGPNGCGKSNVVDAIRWVLGEQSPKHLRGDSMEDVVFKGNDRVAPMGMTQVSLTFENEPDAQPSARPEIDVSELPAHFRNLTEITVSRCYYRSGESEYFINKTPCRLKDITELFLGTGVGTKAYAIIEQGRVEQLINAKPEDRRLFIEEAAGTTLYRSRKLAAERKMERTRENLLRVTDVLKELERQIQYLHRLARKAEQYRTLQEEMRALDLMLSALQLRRFRDVLDRDAAELVVVNQGERDLLARLAERESERLAHGEAVSVAEQALSRRREQAALLDAECQSLAERRQLLIREAEERERRAVQLQTDSRAVGLRSEGLIETQRRETQHRDECAGSMLRNEGELERVEAELQGVRGRLDRSIREIEAAKSAALDVATREAEARNISMEIARRRDEARRKLGQLAVEIERTTEQLTDLEKGLATRHLERAALKERLRATTGKREQSVELVRSLAEERRRWEAEARDVQAAVVQARSRLESLREVHQSYEGYSRGVRTILQNAGSESGVLGVVADVLEVPAPYERAVAAALGDRLQYVIVRDGSDGVEAVSALRQDDSGRGSFIPLEPRKVDLNGHGSHNLNGGAHRLLDLIKVDGKFQQIADTLLGEVVLVADLTAGLALWRRNGVYVTMVTMQGDTIDASGVVTGGSERPEEQEIVSRRRLLAELATTLAVLEEQAQSAEAELTRVQCRLESEEASLKTLDRDLHAVTLQLVGAEKDVERIDGERLRLLDRLEVIRFEAGSEKVAEAESAIDLERTSCTLEALRAESEARLIGLQIAQEQLTFLRLRVDDLQGETTQLKVHLAEARQRYEAAVASLVRLQDQITETQQRSLALGEERERVSREGSEMRCGAAEVQRLREERLGERNESQSQIEQARTCFESAVRTLKATEGSMERDRQDLEILRDRSRQIEVAVAEQRLRLSHLLEGVRGKYGVELADAPLEMAHEEEEAAARRLETLRQQAERIGEVNTGAIEELRELEARAEFLRAQKQDLEQSLRDLERTIQRLNRVSRTRFAETFAAVNERFQEIVPRLFRGGEARLVLTDENNLMDSGVEIIVRPPGKRLETMTLLSGGEKALVAVSLIFSLFLINPTPFCFLDEVDAPLDDANIGRFTEIVQEMSQKSQFIVITHNKRTMQAANVLYGVTMQDPGVSDVISVSMH